jgi:hypothetical protein
MGTGYSSWYQRTCVCSVSTWAGIVSTSSWFPICYLAGRLLTQNFQGFLHQKPKWDSWFIMIFFSRFLLFVHCTHVREIMSVSAHIFKFARMCWADFVVIWFKKYSGTSIYVLNPFQILGLIPNRTYTKRIFSIKNKGKMINPFPWKKILLLLAYYIVHWWGCIK